MFSTAHFDHWQLRYPTCVSGDLWWPWWQWDQCVWWKMKLTRKQKLVRTLGFFLDFFPQLILTTRSWDSLPVCLVTMVTMGPVRLTKLTRKRKLVRTLDFFLEIFSQLISTTGSWDSPPVYQVTHGDHGTSVSGGDHGICVSDKID